MTGNMEQEIRNTLKGLDKNDIVLVRMDLGNNMALFIRDDDKAFGILEAISTRKEANEISFRVAFDNGTWSQYLYIGESLQDQIMFQMFCNQQVITIVHVDSNADIHRVESNINPLFGYSLIPKNLSES